VKIFSRSFFAGGARNFFFSPGSEPALGGPLSKFSEKELCCLRK